MAMLRPMNRQLFTIILLLLTLAPGSWARQPPTSFCKCICFTNSTIIPLNSPPQSSTTDSAQALHERDEDLGGQDASQHKRLTCNDCTRAFCLDSNLPICKGAKEEDVFTSCFRRDSLKDETIVLLFIVVTTGLLGWALLKPWIDKLKDTQTVQQYAPIGNLNIRGLGRRNPSARDGSSLPAYRDSGEGRPRTRDSGGSESFARQGGLNS